MKGGLIFLVLVSLTRGYAQVEANLIGAPRLFNSVNSGYAAKGIQSFFVGVDFEKRLTKQKHSPWALYTCVSTRYYRTGYAFNGYVETRPEFYKRNGISTFDDTKSKLIQSTVSIPLGFELRWYTRPAGNPRMYEFAVKAMLSNAILLSSSLDETVYSFRNDPSKLHQRVDMQKYSKKYQPGVILEFTLFKYLFVGYLYQPVSYQKAKVALDFNDKSASPFYEMVSKNGVYRETSWFLGVSIPFKSMIRKKKLTI